MLYKELKELMEKLNSKNIEELKPKIIRRVNELILNINDDDMSNDELEELCDFFIMRETIRKDLKTENALIEGLIIENFINAFDEFIDEIGKNFMSDAIELINTCIRSIGGIARGYRLMKKYATCDDSMRYFIDLKNEFYKHLRLYRTKGIYEEQFIVCGLINAVKFELEEKLQEHGRYIISILTDYKTKKMKSIEEFEEETHLTQLTNKMNSEFGIEFQRRAYLWDSLTWKLKDHYYLENLYKEECDKLEREKN